MQVHVKGDKEANDKRIEDLSLISHVANVDDAKSLIVRSATTTHQQLGDAEQLAAGVRPNGLRISVGIEHIDDIKADLAQALNKL